MSKLRSQEGVAHSDSDTEGRVGMFGQGRPPSVFICLGSNVGDRAKFLEQARIELSAISSIEVSTGVLDNPAVLNLDQGPFLNQILEIRTSLSPEDLLQYCKKAEKKIGRIERERYGPREIDIDILAYQGQKRNSNDFVLPHPGIERGYIIQLLAELGLNPDALRSLT